MSDYYEDRDPRLDNDAGRRRRARRIASEDDAWGMAHSEDMNDGDAADVEDWAAGMIDEEGRRYASNDPAPYQSSTPDIPYRGDDPLKAARRGRGRNYEAIEGDSPAMQRARQVMNRYGRQGFIERHPPESEIKKASDRDGAPPRQRSGDFLDDLFNFRFEDLGFGLGSIPYYIAILVVVLLIMLLGCIAAAWITASEIRESLGVTSSYIFYLAGGR